MILIIWVYKCNHKVLKRESFWELNERFNVKSLKRLIENQFKSWFKRLQSPFLNHIKIMIFSHQFQEFLSFSFFFFQEFRCIFFFGRFIVSVLFQNQSINHSWGDLVAILRVCVCWRHVIKLRCGGGGWQLDVSWPQLGEMKGKMEMAFSN